MAKTRAKKETEVLALTQDLRKMKAAVFADLSGLKVLESVDLRRKSRKEDVGVRSAKKTLWKIALKEAGVAGVDVKSLPGSASLLMGFGDEIAPAKVLETFRKDHEKVVVLGGLLESKWLSANEVKALAKLPSKQELIARVVGSIRAPLSGLVNVLQGNLRNLVYVVNAIKDKKSA